MSAPIVELLRASGVPLPRDGSAWRQLLLLDNAGAVPGDDVSRDVVTNRGFNVLVVDALGVPTYFCKIRPRAASEPSGPSLAARLSRVPELASVLPTMWTLCSDDIEIEVSRYVHGDLLQSCIRSMDRGALRSALVDILMAAGRISMAAVRLEPSLVAGPPEIALREAAAWALETIHSAGLAPEAVAAIDAALARAGSLPRVPQHGDLWPRNVIEGKDRWCILDLEFYGRIQIPLYDALHLARTSWDDRPAWRTSGPAWIDELISHSAEGRVYQEVLIDAAHDAGLSPARAGGALVFYVVDIGARLYHRRIDDEDVKPFLLDARRLSDWLLSGRLPEDLLLPGP